MVAFTETLRRWYIDAGVPEDLVGVVPCFPDGVGQSTVEPVPNRVGFVAKDFDAKGGGDVLTAFAAVRAARPEAELVIVGSEPRLGSDECAQRGITWSRQVSRETLLSELVPSFAVLAYPSRMDGLPLVLLEAMAAGVPCVVSDYFALPEVVGNAGRVVPIGDASALATALLHVLDNRAISSEQARGRFIARYSPEVVLPALHREYERTIG